MKLANLIASLLLALPLSALDLSGRVVGADGKSLSNAHVFVYTALPKSGPPTICPSCYRDCGKSEPVAADGTFTLRDLDPSLKFQILAVADGYEPAYSRYVADGEVKFALKPRSTTCDRLVYGKVVDPDGKPVVGAAVHMHAVRWNGATGYGAIPGVEKLSITNRDGEFALAVDDPDMVLDVRVRARNFAPEIGRMLKPGVDGYVVRVDIGAAVVGHLVANGKPRPGQWVAFVQKDRRSANFLGKEEIGTDEKGRFVMTGLGPDEEYFVYLEDGARVPVEQRGKLVKVGADGTSVELGTIELR